MWYGGMDDDDEMGMRADNPIWVAAESVLSRMPHAADVRKAAERRCGTPGCELADHHKGPHSNQLPVGPRQRKKKPPPLPGWRAVRYAAPAGRDERHFKHIQTGRYARGATEMRRMEEKLQNLVVGWSPWFGCRSSPANTGKRTREEEGGGGSTRDDLASEEHATTATPQAVDPGTDPDDNDCDSSEDWEPGSGSGSMHGSQRKHPRRGEASSPASETSEVTEAKCGVCLWDDCEAGNEILLCDGPSCVAAFHQKCAALYASQHTSHSICAKALATAPYPGACPRPSTACLRASGSAPLASSQRA